MAFSKKKEKKVIVASVMLSNDVSTIVLVS